MNLTTDDEALRTRIIGLVLLCFGLTVTYLNYYMRANSESYYPMLDFLGPLVISIGFICVIESPKIPIVRLSYFGWFCLIIGAATGLWNAIF